MSDPTLDTFTQERYKSAKDVVSLRLSHKTLDSVDSYQKEYHLRTKTEAIENLLGIAFKAIATIEQVKDPILLEEFKKAFLQKRTVEWLEHLPADTVEALEMAIKNEANIRRLK